ISIMPRLVLSRRRPGRTNRDSGVSDCGLVSREEIISRAKAQRRKEESLATRQRFASLRLCARTFLLLLVLPVVTAGQTTDRWIDYVAGEYDIFPNVTYAKATNVELKLDLYLPKNRTRPNTTLILFHGGGWVDGQKERNTLFLLPYLEMGWSVVNVEYRNGHQAPAPAAVEDARCALRW